MEEEGLPPELVDECVVMLEGRELELEVTGGTFGNVLVFRAGHPEDPASRRTGQ